MTAPSRATIAGQAYLDLRRKARQDRRPVDELIQLYVLESFLARLAQTPFAERFVLKGGMLLAALRGAPPHPATSTYRPAPRAAAPALCSPQCVRSPPLPSRTEWCSIWTQPPQGKFATRTSTQGPGNDDRAARDRPRALPRRCQHWRPDHPTRPAGPHPTPAWRGDHRAGYPLAMVYSEKIVTAVARGTVNTRWRDFADMYLLARRHPWTALSYATPSMRWHGIARGPAAALLGDGRPTDAHR